MNWCGGCCRTISSTFDCHHHYQQQHQQQQRKRKQPTNIIDHHHYHVNDNTKTLKNHVGTIVRRRRTIQNRIHQNDDDDDGNINNSQGICHSFGRTNSCRQRRKKPPSIQVIPQLIRRLTSSVTIRTIRSFVDVCLPFLVVVNLLLLVTVTRVATAWSSSSSSFVTLDSSMSVKLGTKYTPTTISLFIKTRALPTSSSTTTIRTSVTTPTSRRRPSSSLLFSNLPDYFHHLHRHSGHHQPQHPNRLQKIQPKRHRQWQVQHTTNHRPSSLLRSYSFSSSSKTQQMPLQFSSNIVETVDPCVVLMKQWISEYSHLWTTSTMMIERPKNDNDDNDTIQDTVIGILSLAQGVVYWTPPTKCRDVILDTFTPKKGKVHENSSVQQPQQQQLIDQMHMYGPADGVPEFVDQLQYKIRTENNLVSHKVMVTAGANQAYMNVILCLLDSRTGHDGRVDTTATTTTTTIHNTKNDHNDENHKQRNSNGDDGTDAGDKLDKSSTTSKQQQQQQSPPKSVVFAPYYFNHVMAITMVAGNNALLVGPTTTDNGYPDLVWLEEQLKRPSTNIRMVTVVNPGNPSGLTIPRSELQKLVDLTRQYSVWLVLDCTYEYFTTSSDDQPIFTASDGKRSADGRRQDDNDGDNSHVIHIFSFSKSYSLAGYRCGYVVVHEDATSTSSSQTLFNQMLKVQDTILISPSRITQLVASTAMKGSKNDIEDENDSGNFTSGGKEWVYQQYKTLQTSRDIVLAALHDNKLRTIGGTGSMYVMAELPRPADNHHDQPMDDVEVCRLLVKDYGIAIIPGKFCGTPGWIRVCYANLEPELTKIAAQRLKRGLQTILASATMAQRSKNGPNGPNGPTM